jgi:hypothetical protein
MNHGSQFEVCIAVDVDLLIKKRVLCLEFHLEFNETLLFAVLVKSLRVVEKGEKYLAKGLNFVNIFRLALLSSSIEESVIGRILDSMHQLGLLLSR